MKSIHVKFCLMLACSSVLMTAAVFTATKGTSFSMPSIRANGSEYSLSFLRDDAHSESGTTYTYKKQTSLGNDVYLVSTGGNSRTSGYLATVPSMYDSSVAKVVMNFYKDDSGTIPFRHQSISSVTIKTSANITLSIYTSRDGVTYREKTTVDCSSSGGSYSSFDEYDRFLRITESASRAASARSIKEVDISYECESAIETYSIGTYSAVVKDKSNLDAPTSVIINSDHYGYHNFHYNGDGNDYHALFSWEYDEDLRAFRLDYIASGPESSSIAGMVGTGNSTSYSGYRIFARFTAGWTNYAAVFGNSISIFFHTSQASASDPNQYQRTEPTMLTLS